METEEETAQNGKSLADYVNILKRRKRIIIIPILIILEISIIIALSLPPLYRSEATIAIEQQSIPLDVKTSVVSYVSQRIEQNRQKLMTVNNLSKIINKFNLYSEQYKKLNISDLADIFRSHTNFEVKPQDVIVRGKKSKATLSFKLSFDHKNPRIAQKIAFELVTLFLEENRKTRKRNALDTTTFFDDEAHKFILEIEKTETKMAEYKAKNKYSLPELLATNLSSINRIETNLSQLRLERTMLVAREITLRTQLLSISPVLAINTGNETEAIITLPMLMAKLESLSTKYSKAHPDIKSLQRRIDNFKQKETSSGYGQTKKTGITINNPPYLQVQDEIKLAEIRLQEIVKQKERLKKKLEKTESYVEATAQVERGYHAYVRDLENYKTKYQELKSKALAARLSQSLEEEQKAEKFVLLEQPVKPTKPESPKRLKFLLMGLGGAIGVGLVLGFLVELLDGKIRSYKNITAITGVDPLVVIPYISNQLDLDRKKKDKRSLGLIVFSFSVLIIVTLAIHVVYRKLYFLWSDLLVSLGNL
ncbi:MAG: Wzz/FepE/Etk N-terminal domain-containing protein [Methylococcales bacterium]|nr:Wzz/FepE/Etk N-terminal domain-containing protein [Methylococcales bacterium]